MPFGQLLPACQAALAAYATPQLDLEYGLNLIALNLIFVAPFLFAYDALELQLLLQ